MANETEFQLPLDDDWWKHQQKFPDLTSAGRWYKMYFYRSHYAFYIAVFRLRHPVMYYLFYKWWLFGSISKDQRAEVIKDLRNPTRRYYPTEAACPRWAAVALYHPVVFLFLIVLSSLFQGGIKLFTAPLSICQCLSKKNRSSGRPKN